MDFHIVIFLVALVLVAPLTGVLLYVWGKHGRHEPVVSGVRIIFLVGLIALFAYMLSL